MTKVRENPDKEHVKRIREALKLNGGYCPCAIEKIDANKCACEDFMDKCDDPNFHGMCNCGLYEKL